MATVTAEGSTLSEPESCDSNWTMAKLVGGIDGRPYGGGQPGQDYKVQATPVQEAMV